MAEKKAGRFPDPHEFQVPPELEGCEEMVDVAKIMAQKLNRTHGPVIMVIPEQGFLCTKAPASPFATLTGERLLLKRYRKNSDRR